PIWDMIRMVATARIVMPQSVIRLSAGRTNMSYEGQALCFMAGAGSIFAGDKLLTTPNPEMFEDLEMFHLLGLEPTAPFAKGERPEVVDRAAAEQGKTEKEKWSRPGHKIAANVQYTKAAKIKRQTEKK
ncbi:MAG: biotin synthase, partial [Lewinella sp.]|nr:biotin synthase [Lewinella sp.]